MSVIAISGSTGLVGQALTDTLKKTGKETIPLVRSKNKEGILWDLENQNFETENLEGASAIVHLAGYSVAKRWSKKVKEKIEKSRIEASRLLVDGLRKMKNPPKVLISASAVGYYGDRGDEILTEESSPSENFFLTKVVEEWEKEIRKAEELGIRVVLLRFGVILSTKGGALKKMLLPFKLGIGGPISNGKQWMSWISLQDSIKAILFAIENEEVSGTFNVVSPNPATNKDFSKTLGRVLHRPAFLPLPAFQVKLIFGEMAKELLLSSARCLPKRLQEKGFTFDDPDLEPALSKILAEKI